MLNKDHARPVQEGVFPSPSLHKSKMLAIEFRALFRALPRSLAKSSVKASMCCVTSPSSNKGGDAGCSTASP